LIPELMRIGNTIMKRIIILGAKPGAAVASGEQVYCANAAFLSYPDEVAGFSRRIVVASSLVLAKGLRTEVAHHQTYKMKIDAVKDFDPDRLVLFADPGRWNFLRQLIEHLEVDEDRTELKTYSVAERRKLVMDIGQVGYPIMDADFFNQPFRVRVRDHVENWKCRLNWRFGDRKKDVRAKYRPSTGVLALLVAIAENGTDAEYVRCGIGISNRNVYQIGGKAASVGKNRSDVLPRHTHADMMVLKSLAATYRISSTEPELYPFVGKHVETVNVAGNVHS